jgi:PKD repeat protein
LTDILPGLHNVHVLADGYQDYKSEVVIEANTSTVKEVTLKPINTDGYYLPYPGGKTYQCTQSNNNKGGSHQGTWRYAFDFGMPDGHEVVASQDGRVIAFRENSNKSCNSKACIDDANYVRIRHQDGTDTLYYHLNHQSVSVNVGDIVVRGQMIAQSDTTGWCTGAHLDFTRHKWGEWESVPISFVDIAGNGMPQAGNSYTSGNYPPSRVIRAPTATTDTEPPQGSVSFHLTGHPTHTLQLQAADYLTDVTSLRLAVREADLQAATWLSFTTHTVWTDPAVFAQFQDANGNISGAVSDTVDAIGYEPIQAAFAVDPKVCVGQGLSLTNQTTPFCEQCGWLWSFGDGSTSKKANPEFDYVAASSFAGYAAPGMYTVTLTATNAISTSVASHEVEALAGPSSDFTVVQTGDAITVEAAAATDAHYIWNFGDGVTATGRIATHTYADTTDFDTYPVQLRVEGQHGCKSSSHQFLITPPTTLDITGPITGMVEEPYTFTATINTTATRPITYTWDFEGHPIMTHTEGISDTAVFSWTTSGLRQLIVTATNAGGMIASAHSITIYPSVQVDFEATPTDGFAPVTVVFTNTSAGDYTSSLWNFGDGVTSTLEAPTHTYELPGAYTVTLRVNEPGSTDTLTRTDYIAVYEPIQASFTGSPREGVSPFIVHFTNTTTGPAAAWMWDFGDGEISTLQHPTHTYEAAGVYTISLTAQAAGGSALWPGGTDTLSRPSYITIKRTFDVFLPLVIRSS